MSAIVRIAHRDMLGRFVDASLRYKDDVSKEEFEHQSCALIAVFSELSLFSQQGASAQLALSAFFFA